MKILTSLVPKNLEIQLKAIETWKNLGFEVFCFNNKELVDQVDQCHDIIHIDSNHDLFSMMKFCWKQKDFCWIINPFFSFDTDKNTIDKIQKRTEQSLVCGNSFEIYEHTTNKSTNKQDFDWFVINPKHKYVLNTRENFYIDKPLWDYLLCLTYIRKKINLITCATNIGYKTIPSEPLVSGLSFVEEFEQQKKLEITYAKKLLNVLKLELYSSEESLVQLKSVYMDNIYKESKIWLIN